MEDLQKLVTKEFLAAFGTKCKKLFKQNPIHTTSDNSGRWICISTSIDYNSTDGFDEIYLNVQGTTSQSQQLKKSLDSNFYLVTNQADQLTYAAGLNLGQENIESAVFMKDEDGKLCICLRLPEGRTILSSLVDVIASLDDNILFNVVTGVTHLQDSDVEEPELESDYEQIAMSASVVPFSKETLIGVITSQMTEATQFTIVEDQYTPDREQPIITASKSYPEYSVFSKIYEATQADKLSHGLQFQYDWENPIGSEDSPVYVTNGVLADDEVVMIPVPNLFSQGATSNNWVTKVKVTNGLVTEIDSSSSIPTATTNTVGGIKLGNGSTTSLGNKVWIQLSTDGKAFVDSAVLGIDKHRADLTTSDYSSPIPYYNQIWQHIGPTRNGFVNGYFYKSVKTSYQVSYDSSNTPYLVGSQIGTKLDAYLTSISSSLNFQYPFRLYVDSQDYPETMGVDEHYTKIQELNTFKLVNIDPQSQSDVGEVLTLTKQQLSEVLDIQIKTTDGWDVAEVRNVPIANMSLPFQFSSNTYAWKQWDVQPSSGGSGSIEPITNSEIDYLFETHVTDIILSNDTIENTVGYVEQLTATIVPSDASVQTVEWSSNNTTVAVVTADGEVHCIGLGTCVITCASTAEPDIYAECEVTVTE